MKIPPSNILRYMYFFGLAIMLAALPLSKYVMSVAQFYLGGVLILDFFKWTAFSGFLKNHNILLRIILFLPLGLYYFVESFIRIFIRFFRKDNLPAVIFFTIFLMHVLGLIYTSDFQYAFKDLRIKLPLMILPVILSVAKPIDEKQLRNLLLVFIAAVLTATFICYSFLFTEEIIDKRDISVFISHIRFSLLIVFSIFILIYFIFRGKYSITQKIIFSTIALWFGLYMGISVSITGLAILLIVGFGLLLYIAFRTRSLVLRYLFIVLLIAPLVIASFYITNVYQDVYKVPELDLKNLKEYTAKGNRYWHNTENLDTENGNFIWFYLCREEYSEAWNDRSEIDINGLDKRGHYIEGTLIRYLTSRGYPKDSAGVYSLTKKEIRLIENGVTSCNFLEKPAIYNRIYSLIWGIKKYNKTKNASGNSVLQRIEYWKASIAIIKVHWLTGVGTGDVITAIQDQYEKMNSKLEDKFRWRSHNQYLSIFIAFGLFGLLWFLFGLIYPALKMKKFRDYYFVIFFSISILSMMTEDTLETQAGVTLFACLYSVLVFARKREHIKILP